MVLKYVIKENDKYINLKDLLKNYFDISDRLLVKLKHEKKLYINNKIASVSDYLTAGDNICIYIDFTEFTPNIKATNMPLDIVYEDDALLVINKSAGIPVHPSMDHFEDSLSNGIKFYFEKIGLKKKIRPVNRIDKDTTGLVVFAKNEYIQECLVKQMKQNIFKKEYIAVCDGIFKDKNGIINMPIARKDNSIIERCISENGENAITYYEILKEFQTYSAVKCTLETGRTHQIRVHMSYIGHALLGDTLYGKSSEFISRQALHAYKIKFIHPINKKVMELSAPLPDDFNLLLQHYIQ